MDGKKLVSTGKTTESWTCRYCIAIQSSTGNADRCSVCGAPRARSDRSGGRPVPEAVAIDEARRMMGNYLRWPEDFGSNQGVLNLVQDPRPRPADHALGIPAIGENDELRLLLELGWVRVAPGHFQREIEPAKVMTFAAAKAH